MTKLPPGMCERLLAFPIRAGADGEVEVVAADAADPHVTREFVAHLGSTVIVLSAPLAQVLAAAGVRIQARAPERAPVRVASPPSQSERPIPLVRKSTTQSKDRVATAPGMGSKGSSESVRGGAADRAEMLEPPPSSRSLSGVPVRSAVPPSPRPGGPAPTRVSTAAAPVDEPPAKRVPTERGLRLTPGAEQKEPEPPARLGAAKVTAAEAPQAVKAMKATVPEVPKPAHFGKVTMPDAPRAMAKPTAPEAPKAGPVAKAAGAPEVAPKPRAAEATSAEASKPAAVAAEPAKAALKATVIETPKKAATATPKPAPVAKAEVATTPKPAPTAKTTAPGTPKPPGAPAKPPEAPQPIVVEQASIADALQAVELPRPAPVVSPAPPPAEPLRVDVPPVAPSAPSHPRAPSTPPAARTSVAPVAARPAQVSARDFVPKTPLGGAPPAPATSAPTRRVVPALAADQVEDRLVKAENPDEIARCLALGGGSGTVVFGVRPDQFVVRALGGDEARPDLTLPRDAASVMRVAAEQDEFLGPLFDAPAHEPLFTWIESGAIVFAAAVKVRDRAALVLLLPVGTNEDETRRAGRRLARAGARALEELIVRRKRTSHP